MTHDTLHVTLGGGWTFCQHFSFLTLSVWAGFQDLEEKDLSVKGHSPSADLRYGEEYGISPSIYVLAATKG